jgi:hypothetical protein
MTENGVFLQNPPPSRQQPWTRRLDLVPNLQEMTMAKEMLKTRVGMCFMNGWWLSRPLCSPVTLICTKVHSPEMI